MRRGIYQRLKGRQISMAKRRNRKKEYKKKHKVKSSPVLVALNQLSSQIQQKGLSYDANSSEKSGDKAEIYN